MLKELFNLALDHADEKSWPTYDGLELDRTEFLTSSETAVCLRQAFFKKNSEKYSPAVGSGGTNGFAERGNAIETWLVEKLQPLKNLGWTLEYMGSDQRSFYDAEWGISGTPDGLITSPEGKKWMVEIKSIDPRFNKNNLPKRPHLYQVQQNMFLMQQCLEIKLEGAILIYIDASNVFDMREFPISYNEGLVNESIDRAQTLWNAKEPDDLEPEGVFNDDCEYCAFTRHCSKVVDMQKMLESVGEKASPFFGEVGVGETESLNDVERMAVTQWIDAWEGAKQYKEEKDEVDGVVRQLVNAHNNRVQVNGWQLLGKMMPGRETVDKAALKEDGIDLKKYMKVGAPFMQIQVQPPMDDPDA